MFIVEIALLVAGIAALAFGYRKNNRNWLLAAAVLLFLAGGVSEFVQGFLEGLMAGR